MRLSRPFFAIALCVPLLASAGTPFREAGDGVPDFVHFNGMTGELLFPEMMGSGAAFLDYDNDGDLDIYLVQGHLLGEGRRLDQAPVPPHHPLPLVDRLYRNDSKDGVLRFSDVTTASGIKASGYGMGVATGDIDNDGFVDLYLSNFGPNQLWRNRGDGSFEDVTAAWGADDPRWSVSAAFVDLDADGWLDLYIGNYVDFDIRNPKRCHNLTSARDYCGPQAFAPQPDRLLRNRGGKGFDNISERAGIDKPLGGALGVVAADFNNDGRTDIYVANDGKPNQMWLNQGDGRLVDEALLAGVGVNRDGMSEASMGVAAGDLDGDGDEDLFMTHLIRETNTLYLNDGQGWFEERTAESGLALPSVPFTGFGTGFVDFDNDGRLDILSVNGGVTLYEPMQADDGPSPLGRSNQLFRNLGGARFADVTPQDPSFQRQEVSRGTAFGDVDNDGDTDVLVSNNNGPARLLLNTGNENGWLGVRLLDGKRNAIGARLALTPGPDGSALYRRVHTDGSYASASDPRVLFGLGERPAAAYELKVTWPGGQRESFQGLAPGRYHTLRKGEGKAAK